MCTIKYRGTYKDDFGTIDIVVENDFDDLNVYIDGVKFSGSEFDDLEIVDKTKYSEVELKRFTFNSATICNYELVVFIPQTIIDIQNNVQFTTDLIFKYIIGKPTSNRRTEFESVKLILKLDGVIFEGISAYYIDYAFDKLIEKIKSKYKLKNCYGCMYSDYSPYGQQGFGGMYCFVRQREKYLNVDIPKDSYKYNYIEECENDFDVVQEIYCCNKFTVRKPGTGYRG